MRINITTSFISCLIGIKLIDLMTHVGPECRDLELSPTASSVACSSRQANQPLSSQSRLSLSTKPSKMERPIPRQADKVPAPPSRRPLPPQEYPPTADSITQLPVHPDLLSERARADFAVRDLTYILHGGQDNFAKFEHYRNIVETDPVLATMDKIRSYFLPRKELYFNGLRKIKRLKELRMTHNWNRTELEYAIAALAESLPINQVGVFDQLIRGIRSGRNVDSGFLPRGSTNLAQSIH